MRTVRFFRFRHRGSGRFARERVRVHSDTIGVRLSLVSRYPPTEFDYVLEESKNCAIVHGPVELRFHAVRQVGECPELRNHLVLAREVGFRDPSA